MEKEKLEKFFLDRFRLKIKSVQQLGKGVYGKALLIELEDGKRMVLKTMGLGGFGHDHFSDIAQVFIWQNSAFNALPKHVKSYDVVGITEKGECVSVGDCREFYILMEEAKGTNYFTDLDEIGKRKELTEKDIERAKILSNYLTKIHPIKGNNPQLYIRKIRDIVGHGECIMGVLDSYPNNADFIKKEEIVEIVKKSVDWWSKLKTKAHRLCFVHGDFHPGNILFSNNDFLLLDRSRGEWGEAADDLTALSINYIFYSLTIFGDFTNGYKKLFELFFENYLNKIKDFELLEVVAPFYAFRAIVVANPIFYPDQWFKNRGCTNIQHVRRKLINFAKNTLSAEEFNLKEVESYLGEK